MKNIKRLIWVVVLLALFTANTYAWLWDDMVDTFLIYILKWVGWLISYLIWFIAWVLTFWL